MRSARVRASASAAMGAGEPGTVGTPAAAMFWRAVVFTPMASIDSGRGPMKTIPARSRARANSAFSERNPYPGCTASAPVAWAAATMRSMSR